MCNLALALLLSLGKPGLKSVWKTVGWLLSQPWMFPACSLIFTATIGVGILTIAYWQYKTAKNRLRLDLFDRRLPVFEAAMKLAGIIFSKGAISREEVQEFAMASRNVRFLFDQRLQDYCDELHEAALIIWAGKQKPDEWPVNEEGAANSEVLTERVLWFNEQLNNEIPKRFTPFLRIVG